MKKIRFLFLCCAVLFFSCKKNGSPGGGATIDATKFYVSTVRSYAPGQQNVDSFTYNSANLLTKYVQYQFDSTGGSPQSDSLIFVFSYSGSSPVPASYSFSQPSFGTINEVHNLSYDGQNRITSDICPARTGFVTNYTYPQTNLAATLQFSSGSGLDNQIDTLTLSNGNMSSEIVYYPNDAGTADSLEGTLHFAYSSNGNPLYHPQISGTIGHLLFILSFDGFNNFVDFNSKEMTNSITNIQAGQPPVTIKFSLSTDSKGRISQANYSGFPSAYRIVYSYY